MIFYVICLDEYDLSMYLLYKFFLFFYIKKISTPLWYIPLNFGENGTLKKKGK